MEQPDVFWQEVCRAPDGCYVVHRLLVDGIQVMLKVARKQHHFRAANSSRDLRAGEAAPLLGAGIRSLEMLYLGETLLQDF
jgi:hypothetical protein